MWALGRNLYKILERAVCGKLQYQKLNCFKIFEIKKSIGTTESLRGQYGSNRIV